MERKRERESVIKKKTIKKKHSDRAGWTISIRAHIPDTELLFSCERFQPRARGLSYVNYPFQRAKSHAGLMGMYRKSLQLLSSHLTPFLDRHKEVEKPSVRHQTGTGTGVRASHVHDHSVTFFLFDLSCTWGSFNTLTKTYYFLHVSSKDFVGILVRLLSIRHIRWSTLEIYLLFLWQLF